MIDDTISFVGTVWPDCNADKEYFRFTSMMMCDFDSVDRIIRICGPLAAAKGMTLAELGELIATTTRMYNISPETTNSSYLSNAIRMLLCVAD